MYMANFLLFLLLLIVIVLIVSVRIVYDYEKGIKFTLGKFSGVVGGGVTFVFPLIQSLDRVDVRVKTVDVPKQECITKDNVSLNVDAVVYYYIQDAKSVVLNVENYYYATSQLAQTTMKNLVGETTLDDLISKRDEVSEKIKKIIDEETDAWGIKVNNVDLKHVELPEALKRMMAKEAEAEREKRGIIIKSEGEVIASKKFAEAAKTLSKNSEAMELRNLQTINDISSDPATKFIFIPTKMFEQFGGSKK